ncbi:MAG: hypothetical protein J0I11_20960, partial [Actinobacteria bacterium]|nr:hypothetical protein [Actinomycetota bacterium]
MRDSAPRGTQPGGALGQKESAVGGVDWCSRLDFGAVSRDAIEYDGDDDVRASAPGPSRTSRAPP